MPADAQLASDDPRNADAEPQYDSWGPNLGGYWSLDDWITWHNANVTAYGLAFANQKFIAAWNDNSWGSAPDNELQYSSSARNYFQNVGLLGSLGWTWTSVINDAGQGLANAAAGLPAAGKTTSWLLPLAAVAALIVLTRDPFASGRAAVGYVAGGARSAYRAVKKTRQPAESAP